MDARKAEVNMPVHVEHRPVKGNKDWAIVDKSGHIEGRSTSRARAQSSANAQNAAGHGWEPTGKKRK